MSEPVVKKYPLEWDKDCERLYELGTSHGILFVKNAKGEYKPGVAWNGLIAVKQSPDGAEAKDKYANDHKYISMTSTENFKGSIEAFTYPEEFKACDGSKEIAPGMYAGQQTRIPFGLSYITRVGNDTEGEMHGEKIHIIYGAKVGPSSRDYSTINEDLDALEFSWEFSTTPSEIPADLAAKGFKPTAYVSIDGTLAEPTAFKKLKETLEGTEGTPSKLPSLSELMAIIKPAG